MKVPAWSSETTKLDIAMRIATSGEMILVSANRGSTEVSSLAETVVVANKLKPAISKAPPLFTPRVRRNFTETLLWRPELITDEHGHAHISFPMADSITTWNMSVIASTPDGQFGVADRQLHSFQPFFVEHDPPQNLTQGDVVDVPVILRNYTEKPLKLQVEMKPEPWFSFLSDSRRQTTVGPNGNSSVVFAFRAGTSIRHGKQQVRARYAATGDAVEKEIAVHPDGQEITFTTSRLLAGKDSKIEIEIPKTAIPGSTETELLLYPSLIAHVLEATNGIGMMPAGCNEQITSTAFVNLLALQLLKKQGAIDGRAQADLVANATKAVQSGYDELARSQRADGGFAYWDSRSSDAALTAYILRFLTAAQQYVDVEPSLIANARHFLLSKQTKRGAWTKWNWVADSEEEDPDTTAEIARSLAVTLPDAKSPERKTLEVVIDRAMSYLDLAAWQDAYLVGNYAIAASTTGISSRSPEHEPGWQSWHTGK